MLAAAVFGGGIYWFAHRTSTAAEGHLAKADVQIAIKEAGKKVEKNTLPPEEDSGSNFDTPDSMTQPTGPGLQTSSERISGVIADQSLDFETIAERLLSMMPELDESGQAEAARHIINLSSDETLSGMAPLIVENKLPLQVLEVVYPDLHNRPHDVGMPIIASVADHVDHPKQVEAATTLEFLYGLPPEGWKWVPWIEAKVGEETDQSLPTN